MTELKAYTVTSRDEETAVVVFARTNAQAKREGSETAGDGSFDWGRASRSPVFDSFSPGPVPRAVLLSHGWWFECHGCGDRIDGSMETGEKLQKLLDRVHETMDGIWCSKSCHANFEATKTYAERLAADMESLLKAELEEMHPGVRISGATRSVRALATGLRKIDVRIGFQFPGCTYGGSFSLGEGPGKRDLYINNGDKAAWEAFKASSQTAAA